MSESALSPDRIATSHTIGWAFCVAFFVIGILNFLLVHPVPGVFYMVVALVYLPRLSTTINKKFGISIPFAVKVVLGLALLWATLAVGDLAEMAGL